MGKNRRSVNKLTTDEVYSTLNSKQLAALKECQYFGWRLKFIRRPLFQEPIPVIYNPGIDKIGILDADGSIRIDVDIKVRVTNPDAAHAKQHLQEPVSPEAASRKEKRNNSAPIPDNLAELLSPQQMRTLRHIAKFGWQLQFVRRPLFGEPVPMILSPRGDKFATLMRDGRINMNPDLALLKAVRLDAEVQQCISVK